MSKEFILHSTRIRENCDRVLFLLHLDNMKEVMDYNRKSISRLMGIPAKYL